MTNASLIKRLSVLEQSGRQEKKIFQFPELRRLMQLADSGLDSMYSFFDANASAGIHPDIAERRGLIPEIFRKETEA